MFAAVGSPALTLTRTITITRSIHPSPSPSPSPNPTLKPNLFPSPNPNPNPKSNQASELRLYGRWQTIAYVPPTAQGGVVPRSEHGHVELWTDAHLPYATARLREPHVMQVARQLG